jgi:hypothetical protein
MRVVDHHAGALLGLRQVDTTGAVIIGQFVAAAQIMPAGADLSPGQNMTPANICSANTTFRVLLDSVGTALIPVVAAVNYGTMAQILEGGVYASCSTIRTQMESITPAAIYPGDQGVDPAEGYGRVAGNGSSSGSETTSPTADSTSQAAGIGVTIAL